MNADDVIAELCRYESELQRILAGFTRSRDGMPHIAFADDPLFRQYVGELVDLFEDALGANRYSKQISAEANRGVANFTGSPSYKSVENILSLVRTAVTRFKRCPDILSKVQKPEVPNEQGGENQTHKAADIWNLLHPAVIAFAKPRFEAGHYADAVEAVFKELNAVVQAMHKSVLGEELDGVALMRKAFAPAKPTIVLDDLNNQTGRNVQQGYLDIFAGAMAGIRNPKAHGNIVISPERAIHHLMLASLLFFKLDERRSP